MTGVVIAVIACVAAAVVLLVLGLAAAASREFPAPPNRPGGES